MKPTIRALMVTNAISNTSGTNTTKRIFLMSTTADLTLERAVFLDDSIRQRLQEYFRVDSFLTLCLGWVKLQE
ncbi:5189_t:CDS:2, partial [Acaulospora morrowiae]